MNIHIEKIKEKIEPYRQQIINHKVYSVIDNVEALRLFMQHHIYAVWDFMSLLKGLQGNLTCTTVPWFPVGSADTRFLINEIVVGEESDVDAAGNRKSHFELYMDAMNQCHANTSEMKTFVDTLKTTGDFEAAFSKAGTPAAARNFVDYTFQVIDSNKAYLQAAVFTFGREDLIPGMFMAIINDMHNDSPESISTFKYYLDRHIEVDGGHHSHLALQMTANLCGYDELAWSEAGEAVIEALQKRIELWDGVYAAINGSKF